MFKYLIVQLTDDTVSFCHYSTKREDPSVLPEEIINEALIWSMKRNLSIQWILPDTRLPDSYYHFFTRADSVIITSGKSYYSSLAQIIVHTSVNDYLEFSGSGKQAEIILIAPTDIHNIRNIKEVRLFKTPRLVLVLQEVNCFNNQLIEEYRSSIKELSQQLESVYKKKGEIMINSLSDILFTSSMNNCNAGIESLTLAPNGRFYLCPGFYFDNSENYVGDLKNGINIPNQHLLSLQYAPICRICDAFHCRRCIWLNQKMTGEYNTPSKQQCLLSHIERDQSRILLNQMRESYLSFAKGKEIMALDYNDPFDLLKRKYQ